ncbi:MAG: hypothetical protein U0X39_05300 [Bacteroidales bacterium]
MKMFLFILLTIIFWSCESDTTIIVAGLVDDNVLYREYAPARVVTSEGKDSIDLDDNNSYDVVFIKSPKSLRTGFGIKAELLKRSGVMLEIDNAGYAACLSSGDAIASSSTWSVSAQTTIVLQSYECNDLTCPLTGNFADVTGKFIAFRLGDRYGWIKVSNATNGSLSISGFAISK